MAGFSRARCLCLVWRAHRGFSGRQEMAQRKSVFAVAAMWLSFTAENYYTNSGVGPPWGHTETIFEMSPGALWGLTAPDSGD